MAVSKMKTAFEKITNDKELLTSLINAFLTVGDDDNITEDDIELMEKNSENEDESIELHFLDEKHNNIYMLSFEKENKKFNIRSFKNNVKYKGYKAIIDQDQENPDDDYKHPVSIVIVDGSYDEYNNRLCIIIHGTSDDPEDAEIAKMLFPEFFIMQVKYFKPEEYSDEDMDKMLYLWKYFFAFIRNGSRNEEIPKALKENPMIRKALKLCKDDFYDENQNI